MGDVTRTDEHGDEPTDGSDEAPADGATGGIDRRSAIKKMVVGGAVAGVAWAAPRVEGLSLRQDYAAAGSGQTFDIMVFRPSMVSSSSSNSSFPTCPGLNSGRFVVTVDFLSASISGPSAGNNCFVNSINANDLAFGDAAPPPANYGDSANNGFGGPSFFGLTRSRSGLSSVSTSAVATIVCN